MPSECVESRDTIFQDTNYLKFLVEDTGISVYNYWNRRLGRRNRMIDIIIDAVLDSVKALPFLFLAYYLIEYLEHKVDIRSLHNLMMHKKAGVCIGALLGAFPQCGFSVTAANFYTSRLITVGTLLAVFLATSDEAVPILLAEPGMLPIVWKVIGVKIIVAVAAGLIVDIFWKKQKKIGPFKELCQDCHCEDKSILKPALRHTVQLFVFLLIVNLILGFVMEMASESILQKVFLNGSIFQPFLTTLVGMIPNCAASVALTELYIGGQITFGSMTAGLCSGAGLGIAVLLKTNKRKKENLGIILILYLVAVATGLILNIL